MEGREIMKREREREEQSFGATAIASLVMAIASLEQSFEGTSFAARFVFASPSGRRRPVNEANGVVSPLPPTVQFQVLIIAKTQSCFKRENTASSELKMLSLGMDKLKQTLAQSIIADPTCAGIYGSPMASAMENLDSMESFVN